MFVVDQLDRGYGDWDRYSWEWYGDYPNLVEASFAVAAARVEDSTSGNDYAYRIVEHVEHYRSF